MSGVILVTGGAGFLGAALVRRLVERGDTVRVLDDASRGSFQRLADLDGRFEAVSADVRDDAAVDAAVKGCDVVHHLAAVNGTRNFYERPRQVLDVAVRGVLAVTDAAVRYGVRRLMIASSSEVYHEPPQVPTAEDAPLRIPDPYNPRFSYAGGKALSELVGIHYTAGTETECVIFRPHNVYGPAMGFEHVIPNLVQRVKVQAASSPDASAWATRSGTDVVSAPAEGARPLVALPLEGDGTQTRAFCYVEDAVDAMVLLAERGEAGMTYHLGRDVETSIGDLARGIGDVVGLQVRPETGDEPAGGPQRRCPDLTRIRAIGFDPTTTLDEGLRRTIPFYWDHPAPTS